MNKFIQWLFVRFAKPRIQEDDFEFTYHEDKKKWMPVMEKLSPEDQMLATEMMDSIKDSWGMSAFAIGVQVGLMIDSDPIEEIRI